jgi:NAD(P)-dependent dehydrogenase (short-subunit alcohol dehydrogenase family)
MITQNYGRIVNIASTAANFGGFGPAGNDYRASKAGVISITKSLSVDI